MLINASFYKLWTKTLESKHSSTHKNDKKLQSILSFELWQGVDCNQQLLLDNKWHLVVQINPIDIVLLFRLCKKLIFQLYQKHIIQKSLKAQELFTNEFLPNATHTKS